MAEQEISIEQLRRWLLLYADYIAQRENQLTELDAAIGDADHGINMRRGTDQVRRVLIESEQFPDVTTFWRTVAFTLINSIGGAAGPLYGSFFLNAANVAKRMAADVANHAVSTVGGREPVQNEVPSASFNTLTMAQVVEMFESGLNGVKQRGKASLGEKTMIDALEPAVEAMKQAVQNHLDISTVFKEAETAARAGMIKTIELVASKGRASYMGERSRGHQDPGATSAYFLFEAAAVIWCEPSTE